MGDGSIDSTSSGGEVFGGGEVSRLVPRSWVFRRGGKGRLQDGVEVVWNVFIESKLSSSLSFFSETLSLSDTGERDWGDGPKVGYFSLVARGGSCVILGG